MAGRIEVERNRFGKLSPALRAHLDQALENATDEIVQTIKQARQLPDGCPVTVARKQGENTIKVGDRRRFFVGFIEYGTRFQPAQPFVTPAAESARPGWERSTADLEKALGSDDG